MTTVFACVALLWLMIEYQGTIPWYIRWYIWLVLTVSVVASYPRFVEGVHQITLDVAWLFDDLLR